MISKLPLSITGFIPLYILLALQYVHQLFNPNLDLNAKINLKYAIGTIVLIEIISFFMISKYISKKESAKRSENIIKMSNIKIDKKAHIDYMITYLLPLLTFNSDKADKFSILYANALILIFVIMNARSENFNFNIVLYMKGYSVYKGINENGDEKTLLIKHKKFPNKIKEQCNLGFVSFAESKDVYLCKKYD